MNRAEQLFWQVKPLFDKYDLREAEPFLEHVPEGARRDVEDRKGTGYYQWLPCLIKAVKPKLIVELGGAMGVSALMMLSALPKKSKIFSITLEEHGLEFSYIKKSYPQLVKIIGNDLDMGVWPKSLDWKRTDILFIDSEHEYEQLKSEYALYLPRLKKGTIILIDDIHLNEEMWKAWVELDLEKYDASVDLHWCGFGIAVK